MSRNRVTSSKTKMAVPTGSEAQLGKKDIDKANFMNIDLHFSLFKCIQSIFVWVVGVPFKPWLVTATFLKKELCSSTFIACRRPCFPSIHCDCSSQGNMLGINIYSGNQSIILR